LTNKDLENIKLLESCIGYTYKDKSYALQAIIHSSYAYEHRSEGLSSNERLEFLGDSVLNFVITDKLFKEVSDMPEGEMSRLRASVVSEASLSKSARKINLGQVLLLGKGEETMGGRNRSSLLADAMEAIIGSIYLDNGLSAAEGFISAFLKDNYEKAIQGKLFKDHKTRLQEVVQRRSNFNIKYNVIDEEGPDHDKVFTVAVYINGERMGVGSGKTKKEAEQKAAGDALHTISSQDTDL
jgi:ribonuclease-3